ncbi:MAG: hypothetical protein ED557_06375 [Balneola sp.]|nr:MAG: hypothetical protein ED557_06375 [Balneola sp.]
MSFLSPFFLIAMTAIGLPLLIHLLNLKRPKRIQFSTLTFFEELQKTTIRKIRIKKYLLLLFRLLAIACLAVVLARPFLPPGITSIGDVNAPTIYGILVDNSISMTRIGQNGPLIEQTKEVLKTIELSSKENDRFILQTTNGEELYATVLGHGQFLRRVDELQVQSSGNYTAQRVNDLLEVLRDAPYENKRFFLISDGQRGQLSELAEQEYENDLISRTLINLDDTSVQNTAITGLETSTNMIGPGLPVSLSVTVENMGDVPIANQFLSLEFMGSLVGQYSLSMEAGSSRTFAFEVTPSGAGSSTGKVVIEGDEFTLDNEYFFTVQVPDQRRILWVKEESFQVELASYTRVVLDASGDNDAQISYTESDPEILSTVSISEYDAIILDGLREIPEYAFDNLQEYVQSGGGVLFFPSEQGELRNYNAFFQEFNAGSFEGISGEYSSFNTIASGNEIQEDHPIFSGLFEKEEGEDLRVTDPDIYYYFRFSPSSSPGGIDIISLRSGDPLFREKRFGYGRLIISSIGNAPGWSNFTVNPLYAPFYYRTLLYASSSSEGGFSEHVLGEAFEWVGDIDAEEGVITVQGEQVIPDARVSPAGVALSYPAKSWNPGWVNVSDQNKEYAVAVNLERSESEFDEIEMSRLEPEFLVVSAEGADSSSLESKIRESGFGKEIWTWFMISGLLFLVIESLISIFYKAETIS